LLAGSQKRGATFADFIFAEQALRGRSLVDNPPMSSIDLTGRKNWKRERNRSVSDQPPQSPISGETQRALYGITSRFLPRSIARQADQIGADTLDDIADELSAEIDQILIEKPLRRRAKASSLHQIRLDEFLANPVRITGLVSAHAATTIAFRACAVAKPWFRSQQFLSPKNILRAQAQDSGLSLTKKGFGIGAIATVFVLKFGSNNSARRSLRRR